MDAFSRAIDEKAGPPKPFVRISILAVAWFSSPRGPFTTVPKLIEFTGATLSAGTDNGGGSRTLTATERAGLTITPPARSDSECQLTVTATAT